jgi:hypothetical protein
MGQTPETREGGRPVTTTEEEVTINLDKIVEILKAQGIPAYVEQTGGGCATIFAGVKFFDPGDGYDRYPAVAGPGWFEGPDYTEARACHEEFSIGWDDSGESNSTYIAKEGDTEEVLAAEIAKVVVHHTKELG